jgi:hypothetical protein
MKKKNRYYQYVMTIGMMAVVSIANGISLVLAIVKFRNGEIYLMKDNYNYSKEIFGFCALVYVVYLVFKQARSYQLKMFWIILIIVYFASRIVQFLLQQNDTYGHEIVSAVTAFVLFCISFSFLILNSKHKWERRLGGRGDRGN